MAETSRSQGHVAVVLARGGQAQAAQRPVRGRISVIRTDFPAAKLADTSSAPSVDDSRASRKAVPRPTTHTESSSLCTDSRIACKGLPLTHDSALFAGRRVEKDVSGSALEAN